MYVDSYKIMFDISLKPRMEKSFREMTNVPVRLQTFHKMSFTEAQPYSSKLFVEQIHTYEKEII